MSLTGPDWVKLNRLLDQALDLEPALRSSWMDSLPAEYAALRDTLRELLFRQARVETAEVMRRAPPFPLEQLAPVAEGSLVGPYRLIREIGSGGMATVWLAERADGSLQRRVALKLPRIQHLDSDLADRLSRERDILASLEHPGIARLYDAGVHRGVRPYLALEYVDGLPLDLYVARHSLSVRQRLALFEQVARAVAHAHARLIVHRDLKPSNVLVRDNGEVLLLDFGIARLLQPDPSNQAALHAFTPRYAAPEQFAGEAPTVATDVYSLGVLLFELLTGRSPYEIRFDIVCLDARPLLAAVVPSVARELGRDLAAIVAKALKPQPKERYATLGELLDDLTRYRRHQPVRAMPDTLRYRMSKFVRRYDSLVGLGAIAVIALIVGSVLALRQAGVATRERNRAVQMLEQSTATNEFWNTVLAEGVANDETVNMQELLKRSERMAEEVATSSPLQYAVGVDAIASLYLSYGLPGKAEALLARTLERYQGIDEGKHVMCYLRCKYALAIGSLGRTQEADEWFSTVLRGAGNEPGVLQYCLQSRAAVASENFDGANALQYIQEAQRLHAASPVRSPWQSAQLLGELAYAYGLNGEVDKALAHYEQAWRLFVALGREESHVALSMLNNWGILEMNMGHPAQALARYSRAVEIAKKRSPDGEPAPDLLGNRAAALAALGRFDEAIQEFDRMRARVMADGNTRLLGFAVAGNADANLHRGEVDLAGSVLAIFSPEQRKSLEAGSPPLLRVSVVEARWLMRRGEVERANELLSSALQGFARRGASIRPRVQALLTHAESMLVSQRFDVALADVHDAVAMARRLRGANAYSDIVGLARLTEGRVQSAQGDQSAARQAFADALVNLRNTLGDDHPDTQAARLAVESV